MLNEVLTRIHVAQDQLLTALALYEGNDAVLFASEQIALRNALDTMTAVLGNHGAKEVQSFDPSINDDGTLKYNGPDSAWTRSRPGYGLTDPDLAGATECEDCRCVYPAKCFCPKEGS